MRSFIVAGAIVMGLTGAADAACSTKALGGLWTLFASTPAVCLFESDSDGRIINSRCYAQDMQTSQGNITGWLAVAKSCAVSGVIKQRVKGRVIKINITGKMTDETTVVGEGKSRGKSAKFVALKQW